MDMQVDRFVDLSAFAADVSAATDAVSATALFRPILRNFGFDTFSCGEIDLVDFRRAVFYVVDWPSEFAMTYHQTDLIVTCPLMRGLTVFDRPYCWADARSLCFQTKGSWRMAEAARANGWDEGLIIPLPRGGTRRGVVSMMGRAERINVNERPLITALATVYYERVRGLLTGTPGLISAAKLTPKEVDCLRFVASGLPDAAVAEKLGVSQISVHEYLQRARMRLGAKTRAETVAIVISLGLVAV